MVFQTEERKAGQVPTITGYWYVRRVPQGEIIPVHVKILKNGNVRVNRHVNEDLIGWYYLQYDKNTTQMLRKYASPPYEWFGPVNLVKEK